MTKAKSTASLLFSALVLVVSAAQSLHAQGLDGALADYTATSWSEKDGLPSARISAIAQDADGYLWLATDADLVRFDGVRFVSWGQLYPARLPNGIVHALLSARDRSLWVAVGDNCVARTRDGTVRLYGERDGLEGQVNSLLEDRAGTIWAGTRRGLYRFRDDRWERIGLQDGLTEGPVIGAYQDSKNRLWVATLAGVFRSVEDKDVFQQVEAFEAPNNFSATFAEDSAGSIWVTDFRDGFRAVDDQIAASRPSGLRGNGAEVLHDRRGNLWVATEGQGLWLVRANPTPHQKIETVTVRDGLATNVVRSLLEDREGNIWVGTTAGLHRFSKRALTPVTDLELARTVEVTSDGAVWVGTADGLVKFSKGGRQHHGLREGLPGSIVSALHTDTNGTLWVATERGLARLVNGSFARARFPRGSQVNRVVTIASSQDAIWFRDLDRGLLRWSAGVLSIPDAVPEVYRKTTWRIYGDKGGSIWVGCADGRLGVLRPNGVFQSYQLAIGGVTAIQEDAFGTMWIGGESGLSRFEQGRFVTVSGRNGFPGGVRSIAEDRDGILWIGVGSGIVRLDRSEFAKAAADAQYQVHYTSFDSSEGVAGAPIRVRGSNAVRAQDGRLWFVTSKGVTIVDPRHIGDPHPVAPVRIEAVTANTRRYDPTSHLRLPASTSHLEIEFTALTLTDPMRVRLRYRLEGYDDDWVEAASRRQASYTNLPPRNYRFRAIASNHDGTWLEPGAVWDFSIAPKFYQTRWFLALCVLSAALFVVMSWRFRVRQVRRQFALVLAERIRISRAIHDTLLQGLVGIALQLDHLSHDPGSACPNNGQSLARLRRHVEDYIREARQSIWDLRSPTLERCDLPAALREAGERAVGSTPVQIQFSVRGTPYPCSPNIEEQLLLIGQEALNNALHHAHAQHVELELAYDDHRLGLRVSDDGCGFDPEVVNKERNHYGLMSMQERADQFRGQLTILTRVGGGPDIQVHVPTD